MDKFLIRNSSPIRGSHPCVLPHPLPIGLCSNLSDPTPTYLVMSPCLLVLAPQPPNLLVLNANHLLLLFLDSVVVLALNLLVLSTPTPKLLYLATSLKTVIKNLPVKSSLLIELSLKTECPPIQSRALLTVIYVKLGGEDSAPYL